VVAVHFEYFAQPHLIRDFRVFKAQSRSTFQQCGRYPTLAPEISYKILREAVRLAREFLITPLEQPPLKNAFGDERDR
jgi:hypothetical protein